MAHTQVHYDMLEALQKDGCAVCRLVLDGVQHYLDSINYEYVNDPVFRAAIEPAQGFCNIHADQWLHMAHVLGTALIYKAVLTSLTEDIRKQRPHRQNGGLFSGMASALGMRQTEIGEGADGDCGVLRPRKRCPACEVQAELEATTVSTLVEGLSDAAFRQAYESSALLCIPHLRQALCSGIGDPAFSTLQGAAIAGQERLATQLGEIIRKHDYRFHDEPLGDEQDAVARSVEYVAAAPGIGHR